MDVVGNDGIAAIEVPDDVAEDERDGDADLNVRPEPLKSAADIFEMFNQVAMKDGTDDDDIDNLNPLPRQFPRNPFGASVRLCYRVSNKIDEEVHHMVREGPDTFKKICTDEYIDQFSEAHRHRPLFRRYKSP